MTINPKHEIGKDDDFMDILGLIEYEVGDDVELNVTTLDVIVNLTGSVRQRISFYIQCI